MLRRLCLVAVIGMLSVGLISPQSAEGARGATSRSLGRTLPEMNFDGIALTDCVDFLRDITAANIVVNWRALEGAGVTPDTVVNLKLRSVSLRKALSLLLSEAGGGEGITYTVDEGVIEITTTELANARTYTRVYDVADLLMEIPDFTDAPDFSLQQSAAESEEDEARTGRGGDGGGGGLFGDSSGGGGGGGGHGTGGRADGRGGAMPAGMGRQRAADQAPGVSNEAGSGEAPAGPTVAIEEWDPETPYLKAMRAAGPAEAYAVYLDQRKAFGAAPAFYLDCADHLLRNGRRDEGLRVLTNVAELQLEDARLLRVVAHRLTQLGELDLAIAMFERVLRLRPEEPQSHRDLALALADRADRADHDAAPTPPVGPAAPGAVAAPGAGDESGGRAAADYARALELLNKVVMDDWDRFEGVQVVALMEANRVLARLAATPNLGDVPIPLDPRLRKVLDLDVRVVLTWDADQTDIDLWVTEPTGEVCKYDHSRTAIGGLMSDDFTDGYGPEEYCLRRFVPGKYKIQANFYGSGLQQLAGPTTVQATVITNFGRPNEKRQALTVRLASRQEVVDIGTVTLNPPAAAAPAAKP
ncbi:MAG: hypothetical protein AVDCRST_MAG64-778 [uncultured Phycisphaerae bacterium]|uniref:DUF2135 domain-containing protein n=1 Tax=uncultured Phycisphaerae bacterium TaxID=904963 RepID=A0A6J4NDG2_9BACT|nr:MAG: hypothetical protein AVDCRST_MAG64-778 [uncultured Phycisphaerae bacterium]